jgi:hypothetical protein
VQNRCGARSQNDTRARDDGSRCELPTVMRRSEASGEKSTVVGGEGIEIAIREIELVLAEKRTALSLLRTGIAVFALPLSVLSVLIATSRLYDAMRVAGLLAAVLIICAALTLLGIFLVVRAVRRIHAYDGRIVAITQRHRSLAPLLA